MSKPLSSMSKSEFLAEIGRYIDIVRDGREKLENFSLGTGQVTVAVHLAIKYALDTKKNIAQQMAALEQAWEVELQIRAGH